MYIYNSKPLPQQTVTMRARSHKNALLRQIAFRFDSFSCGHTQRPLTVFLIRVCLYALIEFLKQPKTAQVGTGITGCAVRTRAG